jgi:hypothetical protein
VKVAPEDFLEFGLVALAKILVGLRFLHRRVDDVALPNLPRRYA